MYFRETDCHIEDFQALLNDSLQSSEVPFASEIVSNVPVYDMPALQGTLDNSIERTKLMAEWSSVLMNRSGAVIMRGTYPDTTVIDDASAVFLKLIEEEKAASGAKPDHFASKGSNDRLWNSLQKLAKANPDVFTAYHANPNIDAISEAWLGPSYQMTSQLNLVHPGGAAQQPHRDYHLGFQTNETCERYPSHVHTLSPVLTLQGAVAHCDMPVESGVTQLLPFSQKYEQGYLAYRQEAFKECFKANYVQVPLKKGDAAFFNPAIFHAAGDNVSKDIHRLGNLLQISSAYGRAMENIDRQSMCQWIFPSIKKARAANKLSDAALQALIAACAEGYSFPTNLDTDPPVGGLAPRTQQQILSDCVAEDASEEELANELQGLRDKQPA